MMWGYYPGGGGWPMMVLGNVLWIALLGLLVWAIIHWLEYRLTRKPGTSASGFSALEILRQRYARGEIDTPTFEQMRERLEGSYAIDEKPENKQPRAIHSC